MVDAIKKLLMSAGVGEGIVEYLAQFVMGFAVLFLAFLGNFFAKKILLWAIRLAVSKTKNKWDDAFQNRRVFDYLSHLVPAIIIYLAAPLFPGLQIWIEKLSIIYFCFIGILFMNSLLNATDDIYRTFNIAKDLPIKGFLQIIKIVVGGFIFIIIVSTLIGKSPWVIVGSLGAMTAVLLLVFKDSLLGFVASLQLTFNDMVRIGDWIEMPKFGADGDIIDITLHTVKVRNWDMTVTTIPSYALISDSFKNWRGMSESGGRRIKRALNVDVNSVRFCTNEMLTKFEKFEFLSSYIKEKREELSKFNQWKKISEGELINGRHLTNIGTFRAYIQNFLENHPMIHKKMTLLVRQLPSTEKGIPIEIYCFSNDQNWNTYEQLQSDIFDHLFSVVQLFDLKIFQAPSGIDFNRVSVKV